MDGEGPSRVRDVSMNLPPSFWPFRNVKGSMLLLSTVSKATTIFPFILKKPNNQKKKTDVLKLVRVDVLQFLSSRV